MKLNNNDLRQTAKNKNICLWEIAEKLRISEPTMTRKLRHELPPEEKSKILSIIDTLSAAKQESEVRT